jgi:hypothetical protein
MEPPPLQLNTYHVGERHRGNQQEETREFASKVIQSHFVVHRADNQPVDDRLLDSGPANQPTSNHYTSERRPLTRHYTRNLTRRSFACCESADARECGHRWRFAAATTRETRLRIDSSQTARLPSREQTSMALRAGHTCPCTASQAPTVTNMSCHAETQRAINFPDTNDPTTRG